ncbi:MAG: hypothetical protein ABSE75_12735, partial [Acidimicrobiales bacterium]
MSDLLRGDEILACVHRVALSRGAPVEIEIAPTSAEMQRRRRDAEEHRRATLGEIKDLQPDAVFPSGPQETSELMRDGAELILRPRVVNDDTG